MIYVYTDRKRYTDWKLFQDIAHVVRHQTGKGWEKIQHRPDDIVFNLSMRDIPKLPCRVLNENSAKNKAKHKAKARKLFAENGVPVPLTWYDIDEAVIPYIARPPFHFLGRRLCVVRNIDQHKELQKVVKPGWYFSEIFPTKKEYRVMVFNGEILYAHEKPVKESVEETVRHRTNSNQFIPDSSPKTLGHEHYKDVLTAVELCGLDFAGVDIVFAENPIIDPLNSETQHNHIPYVIIEVNAAPHVREWVSPILNAKIKEYEANHIH